MEIKKKNKEEVFATIKDYILSIEVIPGQNITENALSELLGIGRTPVREALSKLESEGLIITHKGRKTVYSLTLEEIKEIFEIKAALEGHICNLASIRGSQKEKEILMANLNEMLKLAQIRPQDTAQRDLYLKKWLEIDAKIHKLIFKMANSKKAEEIVKKLNMQWHRTRVSVYTLEGRIARSAKEHESFILPIIQSKGEESEKAMKIHLKNMIDEIEHVMRLFKFPLN